MGKLFSDVVFCCRVPREITMIDIDKVTSLLPSISGASAVGRWVKLAAFSKVFWALTMFAFWGYMINRVAPIITQLSAVQTLTASVPEPIRCVMFEIGFYTIFPMWITILGSMFSMWTVFTLSKGFR